ncbi:hypothetical protein SDC9_63751 [bioreactor metagenome]|uniref:Uncharacterized protein n=1 Tax=bioreactor metagenome TaxID=1076179 RepID=A0A644XMF5_9ZZZZ
MNYINVKKMLFIIFTLLILIFIVFGINRYQNPNFDFITYLSGTSSFFVAILTVLYVLTTTKQLEIMNKQLNQMEQGQALKSQPFPILELVKIELERPRFFYTPPKDEYSFHSKIYMKGLLNNLLDEPVICIDISAEILLPSENKKLKMTTKRIEALKGKEQTKDGVIELMYPSDYNATFINAIRENKVNNRPKLSVELLYRSISGGYFCQNSIFHVLEKDEANEQLKQWNTYIVSFNTKFRDELDFLKKCVNHDEKWDKVFSDIKELIVADLGDESRITFDSRAIYGSFDVKSISKEEYDSKVKKRNYGVFLGKHPKPICKENSSK